MFLVRGLHGPDVAVAGLYHCNRGFVSREFPADNLIVRLSRGGPFGTLESRVWIGLNLTPRESRDPKTSAPRIPNLDKGISPIQTHTSLDCSAKVKHRGSSVMSLAFSGWGTHRPHSPAFDIVGSGFGVDRLGFFRFLVMVDCQRSLGAGPYALPWLCNVSSKKLA